MEITKHSDTEIKISKPTERIISLENLRKNKEFLEREILIRQTRLNEINFFISECLRLRVI